MWAVLVDKGYQGSQSFIRAIHPKKKPIRGNLTVEDTQRNIRVSSDRVLVETYFGRVTALWKISRIHINGVKQVMTAYLDLHLL